jgi:uncharacterized membrane protein
MKKVNLVIVIIYFLLAVYYAIFNWSTFAGEFTVDVGFTYIKLPLIALIVLFGLSLVVFQWLIAIVSDLSAAKKTAQKDEEMNSVKAAFYDSNENRLQKISDSIEQLFIRIDGISRQISSEKKIEKELPLKENKDKNPNT